MILGCLYDLTYILLEVCKYDQDLILNFLHVLRFSLKLSFDEKCHDLEMAKRNIQELTIMLEEKNADTMSDQQHKLQSIAGKVNAC